MNPEGIGLLPLRALICPPKESYHQPSAKPLPPPPASVWHRPLSQGTLCKPRFLAQLSESSLFHLPLLWSHVVPPVAPLTPGHSPASLLFPLWDHVPQNPPNLPVRPFSRQYPLQEAFPDRHPETPPLPRLYPCLCVCWLVGNLAPFTTSELWGSLVLCIFIAQPW